MNTHSFIPHHLFVAAVSGERQSPPPPAERPVRVTAEADGLPAGATLQVERRREMPSSLALRRVLSLGNGAGI